jgi:hypothetical protein
MRNVDVDVNIRLKMPVEADSWDGHKEAETKILKILDDVFNEAVDNFVINGIEITDIDIEQVQG